VKALERLGAIELSGTRPARRGRLPAPV